MGLNSAPKDLFPERWPHRGLLKSDDDAASRIFDPSNWLAAALEAPCRAVRELPPSSACRRKQLRDDLSAALALKRTLYYDPWAEYYWCLLTEKLGRNPFCVVIDGRHELRDGKFLPLRGAPRCAQRPGRFSARSRGRQRLARAKADAAICAARWAAVARAERRLEARNAALARARAARDALPAPRLERVSDPSRRGDGKSKRRSRQRRARKAETELRALLEKARRVVVDAQQADRKARHKERCAAEADAKRAAAACKVSVAAARPKRAVRQAAPAEAHGSRTASSSAPFGAVWAALAALWSCATTAAPARSNVVTGSRAAVDDGAGAPCFISATGIDVAQPLVVWSGAAAAVVLRWAVDLEHFIGLRLLRVGSFVDVPCFSVMTGVAVGPGLLRCGGAAEAILVVGNAVDRRRVSGTSIAAVDDGVDVGCIVEDYNCLFHALRAAADLGRLSSLSERLSPSKVAELRAAIGVEDGVALPIDGVRRLAHELEIDVQLVHGDQIITCRGVEREGVLFARVYTEGRGSTLHADEAWANIYQNERCAPVIDGVDAPEFFRDKRVGMRDEKWAIQVAAYGEPSLQTPYTNDGLRQVARHLGATDVPLRIIDVSPFLFMSRHHYETARRRLFEVVDIMRKDKGIVVLVFDVLKMLKWRYAREPFASVCERKVAEQARGAGEPGAPGSEPTPTPAAATSPPAGGPPTAGAQPAGPAAPGAAPPPHRSTSMLDRLTQALTERYEAHVHEPTALVQAIVHASPGTVLVAKDNADADATILALGLCFPGRAVAVTVDLDFRCGMLVARPKQGKNGRYESWQVLPPITEALGVGGKYYLAELIDVLSGKVEGYGLRILAPRDEVKRLWEAERPQTAEGVVALLEKPHHVKLVFGQIVHQFYAPVFLKSNGETQGVLEFVKRNASDAGAVRLADEALAFFDSHPAFRAVWGACRRVLQELDLFVLVGEYRSPLLGTRPEALRSLKLAKDRRDLAQKSALLATAVNGSDEPDFSCPALAQYGVDAGFSPPALPQDTAMRGAVKRAYKALVAVEEATEGTDTGEAINALRLSYEARFVMEGLETRHGILRGLETVHTAAQAIFRRALQVVASCAAGDAARYADFATDAASDAAEEVAKSGDDATTARYADQAAEAAAETERFLDNANEAAARRTVPPATITEAIESFRTLLRDDYRDLVLAHGAAREAQQLAGTVDEHDACPRCSRWPPLVKFNTKAGSRCIHCVECACFYNECDRLRADVKRGVAGALERHNKHLSEGRAELEALRHQAKVARDALSQEERAVREERKRTREHERRQELVRLSRDQQSKLLELRRTESERLRREERTIDEQVTDEAQRQARFRRDHRRRDWVPDAETRLSLITDDAVMVLLEEWLGSSWAKIAMALNVSRPGGRKWDGHAVRQRHQDLTCDNSPLSHEEKAFIVAQRGRGKRFSEIVELMVNRSYNKCQTYYHKAKDDETRAKNAQRERERLAEATGRPVAPPRDKIFTRTASDIKTPDTFSGTSFAEALPVLLAARRATSSAVAGVALWLLDTHARSPVEGLVVRTTFHAGPGDDVFIKDKERGIVFDSTSRPFECRSWKSRASFFLAAGAVRGVAVVTLNKGDGRKGLACAIVRRRAEGSTDGQVQLAVEASTCLVVVRSQQRGRRAAPAPAPVARPTLRPRRVAAPAPAPAAAPALICHMSVVFMPDAVLDGNWWFHEDSQERLRYNFAENWSSDDSRSLHLDGTFNYGAAPTPDKMWLTIRGVVVRGYGISRFGPYAVVGDCTDDRLELRKLSVPGVTAASPRGEIEAAARAVCDAALAAEATAEPEPEEVPAPAPAPDQGTPDGRSTPPPDAPTGSDAKRRQGEAVELQSRGQVLVRDGETGSAKKKKGPQRDTDAPTRGLFSRESGDDVPAAETGPDADIHSEPPFEEPAVRAPADEAMGSSEDLPAHAPMLEDSEPPPPSPPRSPMRAEMDTSAPENASPPPPSEGSLPPPPPTTEPDLEIPEDAPPPGGSGGASDGRAEMDTGDDARSDGSPPPFSFDAAPSRSERDGSETADDEASSDSEGEESDDESTSSSRGPRRNEPPHPCPGCHADDVSLSSSERLHRVGGFGGPWYPQCRYRERGYDDD